MIDVIAYLSLSTGHGDVHESTSVLNSLLRAALWCLLLLLWFNLKKESVLEKKGLVESDGKDGDLLFIAEQRHRLSFKCIP